MPVSLFKEKVADAFGVPVGQQRLIFRGKVLKDEHLLSEYRILSFMLVENLFSVTKSDLFYIKDFQYCTDHGQQYPNYEILRSVHVCMVLLGIRYSPLCKLQLLEERIGILSSLISPKR